MHVELRQIWCLELAPKKGFFPIFDVFALFSENLIVYYGCVEGDALSHKSSKLVSS